MYNSLKHEKIILQIMTISLFFWNSNSNIVKYQEIYGKYNKHYCSVNAIAIIMNFIIFLKLIYYLCGNKTKKYIKKKIK